MACGKSLENVPQNSYHISEDKDYCKICYRLRWSQEDLTIIDTPAQPTTTNLLEDEIPVNNTDTNITLSFLRAGLSHKKCIFGCTTKRKLKTLSKHDSAYLFINRGIITFARKSEACDGHFVDDAIEIPKEIEPRTNITLTAENIDFFLEKYLGWFAGRGCIFGRSWFP